MTEHVSIQQDDGVNETKRIHKLLMHARYDWKYYVYLDRGSYDKAKALYLFPPNTAGKPSKFDYFCCT